MPTELTAERLRELLAYDRETGIFTRLTRSARSVQIGDVAGGLETANGGVYKRIKISVDGTSFKAHRLAWLHVYGRWPEGEIDHINGDSCDNRIGNLRVVSHRLNQENMKVARSDSSSGLLGANWNKRTGKWMGKIKAKGRQYVLGEYATPEEAHEAYLAAKRRLHEGCTI